MQFSVFRCKASNVIINVMHLVIKSRFETINFENKFDSTRSQLEMEMNSVGTETHVENGDFSTVILELQLVKPAESCFCLNLFYEN